MTKLNEAISILGQKNLANLLNVTSEAITNWKPRNTVPAKHCLAIQTATKGVVTVYDLRPDVFGPNPNQPIEAEKQ